ncbi:hypothetical protein FRB98_008425 [Tulasnella sp. 332]|nr:hypothetical protein FRB98_008425 [Tulasnella sp. 332]
MSSESATILPIGIYCLQNLKANASFMNLTDGGELVQAHTIQQGEEFRNQYWFIKMTSEKGVYTLRNIGTGRYLEVDGGSPQPGALVYCRPIKDESKVPTKQKWKMWAKEGRWRSNKENATIQSWYKNPDDAQRWRVIPRSQTADEIKDLIKTYPLVKAATNALPEYVWVGGPILTYAPRGRPGERTIFDMRDGVYDRDAIAFAYKNAVNNWARKHLQLDGYFVLCGLAFGSAHGDTSSAVWLLSQDLKGIQYFDFNGMGVQDRAPEFNVQVAFF